MVKLNAFNVENVYAMMSIQEQIANVTIGVKKVWILEIVQIAKLEKMSWNVQEGIHSIMFAN